MSRAGLLSFQPLGWSAHKRTAHVPPRCRGGQPSGWPHAPMTARGVRQERQSNLQWARDVGHQTAVGPRLRDSMTQISCRRQHRRSFVLQGPSSHIFPRCSQPSVSPTLPAPVARLRRREARTAVGCCPPSCSRSSMIADRGSAAGLPTGRAGPAAKPRVLAEGVGRPARDSPAHAPSCETRDALVQLAQPPGRPFDQRPLPRPRWAGETLALSGGRAPPAATLLVLETRPPPRARQKRPAAGAGGSGFVPSLQYHEGASAPLANTVSPPVDRPWHTSCGPQQSQGAKRTSRQAAGDAPERDHRTIPMTALRW